MKKLIFVFGIIFSIHSNAQCVINLSFLKGDPTCFNLSNGFIKVDISGGTSPYSILWNNGSTADSITGLQVGMYVVEVIDSLGCTTTDSVQLQSTDSLIINFTNYTYLSLKTCDYRILKSVKRSLF